MAGVGNPNLKGNKNSGRKSLKEEIENIKEVLEKRITNEMIVALAKSKVYSKLETMEDKEVQGMALPIVLKGMTEKIDHTSKGESIVDNTKIERLTALANMLRKKDE